jgi:hypothetical protein
MFCTESGFMRRALFGINLYLVFAVMTVGRHWAAHFGGGYTLFGVAGNTLKGIATTSLKNLAPFRKEKECSAKFLRV